MTVSDEIKRAVTVALAEDIGPGDVTSVPTIPSDTRLAGRFLVKAAGVLAGLDVVGDVFSQVDPDIAYHPTARDGQVVIVGDVVATVEGRGPGILIAERTALNFLQRMSGIASATRRYCDAVAGTRARILDTRKTVPGLRALDKLAVKLGGGHNHRLGLFDGVLIKDNHLAAAGGITAAIAKAREVIPHTLKIEVEVADLAGLEEAISAGADLVLLDNLDDATLARAVKLAAGRVWLEASGGMTQERLPRVAATGVNLISVGALTHGAVRVDINMKVVRSGPPETLPAPSPA